MTDTCEMTNSPEGLNITAHSSPFQSIGRLAATAVLTGVGTASIVLAQAAAPAAAYSPNGTEISWCAWPSRWLVCEKAYVMGNLADEVENGIWAGDPQFGDGKKSNAFKHSVWNSYMYREFLSWPEAQGFSDRHEAGNPFNNLTAMDYHNNWRGLSTGATVYFAGYTSVDGFRSVATYKDNVGAQNASLTDGSTNGCPIYCSSDSNWWYVYK